MRMVARRVHQRDELEMAVASISSEIGSKSTKTAKLARACSSNGAVGENRTHDLSLTKGLRYHYATTATVVFSDLTVQPLSQSLVKGALL